MLSFFPLDALDEIWDLIESVSEVFPTYFNKEPKSKILFWRGEGSGVGESCSDARGWGELRCKITNNSPVI